MISEETIARVRESVNLVEVVRETVPNLKKSGRNYVARCPFHQERTPSFSVNTEMGVFKCFGCGVGGDAFKFVMLTEGLTYPEAIRKLATRVGITIEEARSEAVSAAEKERQVLYGLLEDAARFYHRHLLESAEARPAREYLEKRGLSQESLVKFQIGFAPSSGQALREAAGRKGWSIETLEKAGLLRRKEGTGHVFDHFWSRIMFPIWDTQGRIIAFGGRAMGEALPKYINSPETPVYSKSRHLYGLFQGLPSLRKQRHVVILEGYMDVAMCHQYGFETTAATLGTALTEEHVRLLRRYAENVTLLFDPDTAGANATLRGGELLIEEGFQVRVVTLPDGQDADEVLVREGREALEGHIAQSVSFIDYCMAGALRRHPGLAPETKLAVAKEVLPLIRKIKDPLLQDEHLTRLAEAIKADKAILGQQMVKGVPSGRPGRQELSKATVVPFPPERRGVLLSLEEEILLLALLYPSEAVAENLETLAWRDARCAEVWKAIAGPVSDGAVRLGDVLPKLSESTQAWLTPLALQQRSYGAPLDRLYEFLESWRRQQASNELRDLQSEIDSMIEGRIPMDSRKIQNYNELSRRLKGSKILPREAPFHG